MTERGGAQASDQLRDPGCQVDAAQVTVNSAISGKPLPAKVWRIDRVMDAASGTLTVLLRVENKDNATPAGIRCSVRF